MRAVRLPVRQGTPEWLAARRELVVSTDIPVLMGLSPHKSEAQLADEKRGLVEPQPASPAMRLGLAMETFVADEYSARSGHRLRRANNLLRHPTIEWAGTDLDREVIGERRIVEIKTTGSRSRFADDLPQDVEAQVRWQLGVTGYPVADVAAWVFGEYDEPLALFTVEHDARVFDGLVDIAADFRARLAAGGPFTADNAYLRRRYPTDNGAEMVADRDLADAVRALVDVRGRRKALEETDKGLEAAIKTRMGEVALLTGEGFRVSWRRTKDRAETDWHALAGELIERIPETDRAAVVGAHVTVRQGFRPFRVTWGKEDTE